MKCCVLLGKLCLGVERLMVSKEEGFAGRFEP